MLANQSEYARRHGVSPPAVRKWIKSGWLVLQGSDIDVEKSDEKLARYRDSKDKRATRHKKEVSKPAKTAPKVSAEVSAEVSNPVSAQEPDAAMARGASTPDDGELFLPGETAEEAAGRLMGGVDVDTGMPIEEAKRIKEVYLALLNRLEYEQKSGDLIRLDLARTVLFECARGARDAWLNWPARVAPLIAADLGIEADRMTEILTEHVHSQIASLGEPEGDFSES